MLITQIKKNTNFLGEISYSLYLNHFVVIVSVEYATYKLFDINRTDMTSFYMWILIVPVCVLFAWVTWFICEKMQWVALQKAS